MTYIHCPPANLVTDTQTIESGGNRYYKSEDGHWYPSVTTVVNWDKREFFAEWRSRNKENAAESVRAVDRGIQIHGAFEKYLNNEIDNFDYLPPNYALMCNNALPYLRKIGNIYALEKPLVSDLLLMGGRCDCVADFDGIPSIIDFKGSKKPKSEDFILSYFAQTTAYSIMWQEMYGMKIPQIVILIVCDDGNVQLFRRKPKDYVSVLKSNIDSYWKDVKSNPGVVVS